MNLSFNFVKTNWSRINYEDGPAHDLQNDNGANFEGGIVNEET